MVMGARVAVLLCLGLGGGGGEGLTGLLSISPLYCLCAFNASALTTELLSNVLVTGVNYCTLQRKKVICATATIVFYVFFCYFCYYFTRNMVATRLVVLI